MTPGARGLVALALLGLAGAASAGCEAKKSEPEHAAPSPQASAEPTPLTIWVGGAGARADGGTPLEVLRPDLALPADSLPREPNAEGKNGGRNPDMPAMHVDYTFAPVDPIAFARTPETSWPFVESLRSRLSSQWSVDYAAGRLRIALRGPSLLPEGTELRARADAVGNVALHRASSSYRPLPPGTLRNFLGEGRFDVSPVLPFDSNDLGEGQRLGVKVRRTSIHTAIGTATLEIAHVTEADPPGAPGPGRQVDVGGMFCRLLGDLVLAPAGALVCAPDELPLHVDIRWASNRGGIVLEAKTLPRRVEVTQAELLVPPKDAQYQVRAWQPFTSRALLQDGELAQLRVGPDRAVVDALSRSGETPPDGLLLQNHRNLPYWLTLDGVAVAWVGASSTLLLRGLQPGRYLAQWSTALDDARDAPEPVLVPGRAEVGIPPTR